jgi:hypothetical protein
MAKCYRLQYAGVECSYMGREKPGLDVSREMIFSPDEEQETWLLPSFGETCDLLRLRIPGEHYEERLHKCFNWTLRSVPKERMNSLNSSLV